MNMESLVYLVTNIIIRGSTFAFIVVCTRIIGVASYGALALVMAVSAFITLIGQMGYPIFSQRLFAGPDSPEFKRDLAASLTLLIGSAVLMTAILFLGSPFISVTLFHKPELTAGIRLISLTILFALPLSVLRSLLTAKKLKLQYMVSNVVELVLKLLSAVTLGYVFGLEGILLGLVLSPFVALIATVIMLKRGSLLPSVSISFKRAGRLLLQSIRFLPVSVTYFLVPQADRLILGSLGSALDVGIYSATSSITQISGLIHGSIVSAFMPEVARLHRDDSDNISSLSNLYQSANIATALAASSILLFMIIFGHGILVLVLGTLPPHAYQVLVILAVASFIGAVSGPTGALLNMTGKQDLESMNSVIFILCSLVSTIVLIQKSGLVGAALANLLSVSVLNALQIIEIYWTHRFFVLNRMHFTHLGILTAVWFWFANAKVSVIHLILVFTFSLLSLWLMSWIVIGSTMRSEIASKFNQLWVWGKRNFGSHLR